MDEIIKRFLARERAGRLKSACPDHETLAAFFEGKLGGQAEEDIRTHLMTCDGCFDLAQALAQQLDDTGIEEKVRVPVRSLNRVMRLDPSREGAWEVVVDFAKGIVESIKSGGEVVVQAPVPAEAFRGGQQVISESLVAFSREFSPYLAEIEVEKIKENRGEITVSVSDKETRKPAKGLRVSLFDPSHELESYVLDKGRAVFENVKFGKYSLELTQKGKKLGKISLNMKT